MPKCAIADYYDMTPEEIYGEEPICPLCGSTRIERFDRDLLACKDCPAVFQPDWDVVFVKQKEAK